MILEIDIDGQLYKFDDAGIKLFTAHNTWHPSNSFGYLKRMTGPMHKRKSIIFARELLGVTDSTKEVDHIDRNPRNNTIDNLRIVSHSLNNLNKSKCKNVSSKYKGVSLNKATGKWTVYVQRTYLGRYESEEIANQVRLNYLKENNFCPTTFN